MKRARPPDITEPRRKRSLSDAENQIWEAFAGTIKPLRKRASKQSKPEAKGADAPPAKKPSSPLARAATPAPLVKPVAPQTPRLATLGRRERSQIARGHKEIDARLDLHGKTQAQAHRVLLNFLSRASENNFSVVLVITGKGKAGSETERGVLRRQVPEWLGLPEFRRVVIGFETAHVGHGGEGALYVRVRRAR